MTLAHEIRRILTRKKRDDPGAQAADEEARLASCSRAACSTRLPRRLR